MKNPEITPEIQQKAEFCKNCPVCQHARKRQRGLAYWFVKNVESGFCPNCAAYEVVYGRKAHESVPQR